MSNISAESDLKDVFKQAADIASVVPASMQKAAFRRALDRLLGTNETPPSPGGSSKRKPARQGSPRTAAAGKAQGDETVASLIAEIDRTRYSITADMKVLERSLRVLQIARSGHEVDGLTPGEIAKVLSQKFRVATDPAVVSMSLGGAGSFVDRKKDGNAYRYHLMAAGEDYLESLSSAEPGENAPSRSRRKSTKPKSSAKPKVSGQSEASPEKGKRKTSSGRPGPAVLIQGLIDQGFFSSPRSIGDMIASARNTQGRVYKATDISPALVRFLRGGKLTRAKNEKGVFEYSTTASA